MNWLVKEVAKRLYWSGLSANEAELFQEIADDRTSTTWACRHRGYAVVRWLIYFSIYGDMHVCGCYSHIAMIYTITQIIMKLPRPWDLWWYTPNDWYPEIVAEKCPNPLPMLCICRENIILQSQASFQFLQSARGCVSIPNFFARQRIGAIH